MRVTLSSLVHVATLVFSIASLQAVTIDFATVGNPGNGLDTRWGINNEIGAVDYVYSIGKYEITAGQYTEFLNAVAKDDINGLYNTSMWTDAFGAQIEQIGDAGTYSYSVAADWANRPVNFVSFWDAARFANWLHNGQPSGPQGPDTTEGGAYMSVGDQATFARQPGAKFFIPTEDEWYKAGYHDKAAGIAASYFSNPTRTGTFPAPGNDITETIQPGNNMNYLNAIGAPYYRTEVGEFELSYSSYGTFDQGGNVAEWNETVLRVNSRGYRGGSFRSTHPGELTGGFLPSAGPSTDAYFLGFRIASLAIPEPSSHILFAMLLVAAVCRLRLDSRDLSGSS